MDNTHHHLGVELQVALPGHPAAAGQSLHGGLREHPVVALRLLEH